MRNVINISLPEPLVKKVTQATQKHHFASKSEFFRYLLREWMAGKLAKDLEEGRKLLEVSLEDSEFRILYDSLQKNKRDILNGKLENYLGSTKERIQYNIAYARGIISGDSNESNR